MTQGKQMRLATPGVQEFWSAYFFKREGIQPIKIDIDDLDVESSFLTNLKASLRVEYNKSMPLRVAVNPNRPDIHGQLVDGLHRSYCIDILFKHEAIEVIPTIEWIYINDFDDLRAKKLYYEFFNQSKSIYVSNKKAEKSFAQTLQIHPELDTLEKVMNFFVARGFANKAALEAMWKRYATIQVNKKQRDERIKEIITEKKAEPLPTQPAHTPEISETETRVLTKCPCCNDEFYCIVENNTIVKTEKVAQ